MGDYLGKEFIEKKSNRSTANFSTLQDDRIVLNVGGTKFETLRSTLTAYPATLLGTMFHERNRSLVKLTDDNEYFFDRDPRAFSYIMEFYRNGEHEWPNFANSLTKKELKRELDFFGIPTADSLNQIGKISLEEQAATLDEFTEVMRMVILEMQRLFRRRITINFPIFEFYLFSVVPDLEVITSLLKPYQIIGSPIAEHFGVAIGKHLSIEFPGLVYKISSTTVKNGNEENAYKWELKVPLAFENRFVIERSSLKR
ncbi:hypothetical protein G9A89_002167 [Geosiphon pyriformis]|nr:hypothetical protein G9A89_002167 [Geosiphon pyriformis]